MLICQRPERHRLVPSGPIFRLIHSHYFLNISVRFNLETKNYLLHTVVVVSQWQKKRWDSWPLASLLKYMQFLFFRSALFYTQTRWTRQTLDRHWSNRVCSLSVQCQTTRHFPPYQSPQALPNSPVRPKIYDEKKSSKDFRQRLFLHGKTWIHEKGKIRDRLS